MGFQRYILIFLILISLPVQAIYPNAELIIHNAKLKGMKAEKLDKLWFDYISDYPKILQKKGKDYKVDQYCSFSVEVNEDGKLNLNSIKLLKHKKNLDYNLKAIQFLREHEIQLAKRDAGKQIKLDFIYHSF